MAHNQITDLGTSLQVSLGLPEPYRLLQQSCCSAYSSLRAFSPLLSPCIICQSLWRGALGSRCSVGHGSCKAAASGLHSCLEI